MPGCQANLASHTPGLNNMVNTALHMPKPQNLSISHEQCPCCQALRAIGQLLESISSPQVC